MTRTREPQGYLDALSEWLSADLGREVKVTRTDIYGTDWAGDTEGGFYSEFEFTLYWTTDDGVEKNRTVKGDDLEALWRHVVGAAWPLAAEAELRRIKGEQ